MSEPIEGVEGMISVMIPCQEDDILLFPTVSSIFRNQVCSQDFEVLLIRSHDFLVPEKVSQFPVKVYSGSFDCQAQALNSGLNLARGNIVCTTKPGCVVAPDWLGEIDEFFQQNPEVDGVGGPVLPSSDYGTEIQRLASEIFNEEQGFPDSMTILGIGNFRGLLHATNSAFRTEAIKEIGFDECLDYDYDFDICWKMVRKRHHLVYNPRMRVRYIFPLNLRSLLKRYYCWGKEKIILQKRYAHGIPLKSLFYTPYNTVRALLEPSPLVSTKKLLRFVQHLAFNAGSIRGYGLRISSCV